jgi:hypothetical protein
MRLRDVLRRKPKVDRVDWQPEVDTDVWSAVGEPAGSHSTGQRRGQIRGGYHGVSANDQNRAGHRLYARVMISRQARRNIVGFGRWRRPAALQAHRVQGSHARETAQRPLAPRYDRRSEWLLNYRQNRRNRLSRPPGKRN